MMDINLNLLSAEKKSRLEYLLRVFLLKDIVELFLFVVAVLSAILIWSWVFLEDDFAKLTASAINVNRTFYSDNQETKSINSLLKEMNLAAKNFSPVTPKLQDLIAALPPEIKLQSIKIDISTQSLNLDGIALSRASLLQYQENLNKIPWINDLETPVSQLFQKQNIGFEFKAKLKKPAEQKTL